jgi:hypothetical protein
MKTFDEYKDGDWVVYVNPGHPWHHMQFQAYKSQWTHDAFRLKYGTREVIADITEVRPMADMTDLLKASHGEFDSYLQRDTEPGRTEEDEYDGIYRLQD